MSEIYSKSIEQFFLPAVRYHNSSSN